MHKQAGLISLLIQVYSRQRSALQASTQLAQRQGKIAHVTTVLWLIQLLTLWPRRRQQYVLKQDARGAKCTEEFCVSL